MKDNKKLVGEDLPLHKQIIILSNILKQNTKLMNILEILEEDGIKDYYVGAGAINQTIFNYYHDYEIDYGIKDYDIVYFDKDLSYEKEDQIIKRLQEKFKKLNVSTDIKNEARVHIWYQEKYGMIIQPYTSVEDAIASWGATITCIGIRLEKEQLIVYAPYGLNDIFKGIIRPVKKQFEKSAYDERASRWLKKWPNLNKIDW